MTTQTGFLLSYVKYGDYDAVLNCFTKEKGYQSFFIKGIFSSKNKKRSYLRPLNELCFTFAKLNKSGKMDLVSQMDLVENPDFYQNVKCNTIVFFIAEFLNRNLKNEAASEVLYQEILCFLNALEHENYCSHHLFMFQFLRFLGFVPLLDEGLFLDPEKGSFVSQSTHHLFDEGVSAVWKELISTEDPYGFVIPSRFRRAFLESLLVYFQIHVSEFREPQSLEIVQQLFE
ncbi:MULTISPECIES: DNA repair protein RecO [Amniculibacterium]|uniref:DNA repair protein RecO n=1 Tax=Amniculibacterium TaxID=2715289 RepID=UPI000F5A57DF|nr:MULTISPECIES: DNA repair protein RecO [Amniculibacterium]